MCLKQMIFTKTNVYCIVCLFNGFFFNFPKCSVYCLHIFILIKGFLYCCYFSLGCSLAVYSNYNCEKKIFIKIKSKHVFLKHFMSPLTSQPLTIKLFNFMFFLSNSLKIKLNRKNKLERDALGF